MLKWLGLENYDGLDIHTIAQLNVQGCIVGDPLCPYRMFRCGEAEMLDFIKECRRAGLQVMYQTPVYITDRNFKSVTNMIEYLYKKQQVKKYLVQDVGLADWMVNRYSDAEAIWSHWGRNRNSLMNHDFISFLMQLGVKGVETGLQERIEAISRYGLPVYAVYGHTTYNTISRECYNQYMLDRYDGMCDRECLQKPMRLRSKNLEMTIDGFLLGRRITYPSDPGFLPLAEKSSENLMVYAFTYEDAVPVNRMLQGNPLAEG